jgi:hypothetical protein
MSDFSDKLDEVLDTFIITYKETLDGGRDERAHNRAKEQIIKLFLDELEQLGRNEYELRDWIAEQRKKLRGKEND